MSNLENTTPVNVDAVLESQIAREAEKTISATCVKHSVTREQLKPEHIAEAYQFARERVKHEQDLSQDPSYQSLQAEREKNRLLLLQIEALKQVQPVRNESGNSGHARSSHPADSEVIKQKLGATAWSGLTIEGRLAASGIPPAEVTAATKEEARALFGRHADAKRASDLYKTSPARYRTLKTVAYILDLAGR